MNNIIKRLAISLIGFTAIASPAFANPRDGYYNQVNTERLRFESCKSLLADYSWGWYSGTGGKYFIKDAE